MFSPFFDVWGSSFSNRNQNRFCLLKGSGILEIDDALGEPIGPDASTSPVGIWNVVTGNYVLQLIKSLPKSAAHDVPRSMLIWLLHCRRARKFSAGVAHPPRLTHQKHADLDSKLLQHPSWLPQTSLAYAPPKRNDHPRGSPRYYVPPRWPGLHCKRSSSNAVAAGFD